MSDKSRAEFEEWAVAEGLTLHGKDGRYLKEIQSAWMAWKASRTALVIELPELSECIDIAYFKAGVMDAIEAAGVRVKP